MPTPPRIERAARERLLLAEKQIRHSLRSVAEGNPLAAEWEPDRLVARLQAKAPLSRGEAESVALGMRVLAREAAVRRTLTAEQRGGPETHFGTFDFVGVNFLERGAKAARAVARVAVRDGAAGKGTGVMVSDRLFLTNNHVIPFPGTAGQLCAEFDFELNLTGRPVEPSRFAFSPSDFFLTDPVDDLDYTLVAVGPRISGPKVLREFGWCPLSDADDKHALGEVANIVQHPKGRFKEVVVRENRLVSRLRRVLHYVADTETGSSGSPVFNNEWRIIALHHWGAPFLERVDEQGQPVPAQVNEGIRASSIVAELRDRIRELPPEWSGLLQQVISLGEGQREPAEIQARGAEAPHPGARLESDGRVIWQVPIELSVHLPFLAAPPLPALREVEPPGPTPAREARLRPSRSYGDRFGYKPRFVPGFRVELPELGRELLRDAARNRQAEPGDDPYELKYHHFSIVMNRIRRLAFFAACNIDGTRLKKVDRGTRAVEPLDPGGLTEREYDFDGADGGETWYEDGRLDPGEYAGWDVYEDQELPGFPDLPGAGRMPRTLQRGHLVRRTDPAWGTDQQALLADADTFHWTNCMPLVGLFDLVNAGYSGLPGLGGGQVWSALEACVLRNAVPEGQRVSVFTGPVFEADDRRFRGIQVPGRFWKIVVWSEADTLRSVAMLVNQRPVMMIWPDSLEQEGSEAFAEPNELAKVEDCLTTVREIETLTGLSFGEAVRGGDLCAGKATYRVTSLDDIPLPPRRGSKGTPESDRAFRTGGAE